MQASMSCPAGYTFDTTPPVSPYAAATETYEPGQRIKSWDHEIIWTKHHLPAIIHFALAYGTSMPKFMKVLHSTGYLFGKHTKERIVETAQFVQQMVHSPEYLEPGSGTAWKSMIQIRLLHAGIRERLLKITRNRPKYHNIEKYGVPINQEDLLAVLFSLSALMWQMMERRLNVYMTNQEREDYMHLWRYAGYMIGVDDILGVTQIPERADACLDSIILHLAAPDANSGQ
ncbi:hypothetical protein EC968_004502 [Mortierella alpina]|nr:hypothetical protein EC968_004502 [Mortierella alpina]